MSNSILPAAGNLDIVNANVRADKFNAATNIGVANTNPDFNFSVGDKFHVNKDSTDPVSITGNVVASGIKISNLTIGPAFDFASVSNVGNVTANVIQFANATTGFTTTANVEIGGNISLTSNAQVKVGSNVLAEYTGPHGRDPTTPLLKKFPEIVFEEGKFDRNDTTNTYVQAGYVVTASSQANNDKIAATLYDGKFPDINTSTTAWQSKNNTYDSSTGVATSLDTLTGITGATSSRNGSYTTLQLPHKIKVSRLQIHTRNSVDHNVPAHPKEVYVYGSNDGSSWTQVGSHLFTSVPSSPIWQRIDINSTTPYKYFVLQTTSILPYTDENGNPTSLNRVYILDLEWYGYEELATQGDTSVDTTFTSIMNTPQTTGANVYVDGNLGETLDNKVSGPDATGPPATYDATGTYWELNGSLESNIAVEANTFLSGDAPHSVSVWFNSSNLEANVSNTCVFSVSDQEKLDSVNLDLQSNTWHNLTYAYQGEGGSRVTYLDGRKVAEDQAEDTFGDYPPFAMTGYSQGGYVVSASSEHSAGTVPAWMAFDDTPLVDGTDITSTFWQTAVDTYDSNGNWVSGVGATGVQFTDTNGGQHSGEWIKLELPHKLKLDYISYLCTYTDYMPKDFVILGSNDDTTWTLLKSVTGGPSVEDVYHDLAINADRSYKYFVWLTSAVIGNGGELLFANIKFYGHRENDLVRLPDPTNVLKYPHIAMTGPAQRGYVASASTVLGSGWEPYRAFNTIAGEEDGWHDEVSTYSDGIYTGINSVTPVTGSAVEG